MKRLLSLVAFFATLQASAQQVNPVPDYVFRNQMSVGRGTVTDTAAYFSIGPRYGATRGMMPPMVVDTASFSANKRNGLLIFSVQKNKFLYWDSVGVKWAEMAGTAGTALTSADTAALLSTRAWRQKGIDSLAAIRIGGSGTTNYVPKFTATSTIGNSQIFDNGTSVGIGTTTPLSAFHIQGSSSTAVQAFIRNANGGTNTSSELVFGVWSGAIPTGTGNPGPSAKISAVNTNSSNAATDLTFTTYSSSFTSSERMRIFSNGRVGINTGATDAGYQFDVNGTLRTANGANFATNSGEVIIASTIDSGDYKLQVFGNIYGSSIAKINYLILDGNFPFVTGANIYTNGQGLAIGTQSANLMSFHTNNTLRGRITSVGEWVIDTTVTDAGDYKLQVVGNIYNTGSITTGAPSGGSIKPWKIGEAATVSPTSPNRTLRVEVDGVVYYIHAKTTND